MCSCREHVRLHVGVFILSHLFSPVDEGLIYVEQAFGVPLIVKWVLFVGFAQEIEDADFMLEVSNVFVQQCLLVAGGDH